MGTPSDLPPVPYKTPVIGNNGLLTVPWVAWFRQLMIRTGGNTAFTNNQLLADPMTDIGDLIYGGNEGAVTRLPGSTLAVKQFLTQLGNGKISAPPTWGPIQDADVPVLNQNTTGSAATLSQVLTQYAVILGDAPGVVAMASLGLAGQSLTSNGPANAPTWQNNSGQLAVLGTRAVPINITASVGVTSTVNARQLIRVQGSGGPVTVTASHYISAGVSDGQELILEGSSTINTLTINNGNGVEQASQMILGTGDKIAYIWNQGALAWSETWRFYLGLTGEILTDDSGNPLTDGSGNPLSP